MIPMYPISGFGIALPPHAVKGGASNPSTQAAPHSSPLYKSTRRQPSALSEIAQNRLLRK
jgi:hypothetical protein